MPAPTFRQGPRHSPVRRHLLHRFPSALILLSSQIENKIQAEYVVDELHRTRIWGTRQSRVRNCFLRTRKPWHWILRILPPPENPRFTYQKPNSHTRTRTLLNSVWLPRNLGGKRTRIWNKTRPNSEHKLPTRSWRENRYLWMKGEKWVFWFAKFGDIWRRAGEWKFRQLRGWRQKLSEMSILTSDFFKNILIFQG